MEMKEERFEKILKLIDERKFIRVEELSNELYVSLPTIRRDLNELQERKLIRRSRGGAMRINTAIEGSPFQYRAGTNTNIKNRLAKAASSLLRDDSVIFIDESSTTLHIIDELDNYRNIRVITDSTSALDLLARTKADTYCLPGKLDKDNLSLYGALTEEILERFGIDFMFFSSSGIRSDGMIVDYNENANALRRRALGLVQKSVFLCDASKYGKTAAFTLTNIKNIDCLVLEEPLPGSIDTGNAEIIYAES